MAWRIDDRWLWLGLGAVTFVAVRGISYALHEVVRLVEVSEPPQEEKDLEEDSSTDPVAISLTSLKTLATCDNANIRDAAIKVVCARVIADKAAQDLIISQLYSPDTLTREIATRAAHLIDKQLRSHAWRLPPLARTSTRTVTRRWVIDGDGRWVAEPGGDEGARQPLRDVTAGGFTRSRFREESPEELALRRRRREAMVLNEGDRPVGEEDIIIQPVEGEGAGRREWEVFADGREGAVSA
ncbi:hypothetical protein H2201_000888 [Coniosporium apollinis]|uniref:Armadillo repeat-containing domain-containing protein n=1 Tax=Coniosporium apollinis TaxID=61459 RepID=A0ABQ9P386_9PEZI|nr:hypothetical protein H2201_000888 [Coniosporium apollinis]